MSYVCPAPSVGVEMIPRFYLRAHQLAGGVAASIGEYVNEAVRLIDAVHAIYAQHAVEQSMTEDETEELHEEMYDGPIGMLSVVVDVALGDGESIPLDRLAPVRIPFAAA